MLFALRYQKTQTANIASLINLMLSNGVSREDARVRYECRNFNKLLLTYIKAGLCLVKCGWGRSAAGRPFLYGIVARERAFCFKRSQGAQGWVSLTYHLICEYRE